MANNDLAIKFSNDVYANKKDVAEYMKTPMIDSIWNGVLEYRGNFMKLTKLRHITGTQYSVCLTPGVLERVNNVERKLMRIYSQYLRLINTKSDSNFKRLCYKSILETVAKNYNLQVDEISLNRILNKNVSAISPELMVLYHYYLDLENIADNYLVDFNQNTLKDYVSIIQGNEETSFRTSEINNSLSRSLINKLYLGIPTNGIPKAVQDLVSFINDPSISMFVKAACSLYYVYYVKPTETYSEDLAILTFKYCLASSGLDEVGTLLNFETLLSDKDSFEKELLESQKSLDLTYFLHYVLKNSETIIDSAMKLIGLAKASDVAKEMFQEEKKDVNAMPNLSELEEQVEVKSVSSKVNNEESKINYDKQIALDTVPTGLSEQEAKKLEEKLIEMNPNLSYGQAAFYARHCTLGSKYTIAMYKKEIGCAYETARTSMDNLVYLGYYRKELFKNKYIYIPVKKR